MANLTAYFQADFTSFTNAVRNTETRLKTFEQNASKVDATLAKMGDKFSGVKVIQDAIAMEKAIEDIGGASKLTAQELIEVGTAAQRAIDKAKALGESDKITAGLHDLAAQGKAAGESLAGNGKTSVAGGLSSITAALGPLAPAIAGAFSIGAVVGFAKEIGSFAGQMVDLHDQTGIAIEDLEALDYVAAGAGLTIEDVTGAVGQLSNRLASGDQSAAAATEKLHLSMYRLLNEKPDEALTEIAAAVAKIQNPMERTAVAMDLFGKSGPRMLRLMTAEFPDLIAQAKASGAVIDEELIRKADAFDDAWTQAIKRVKAAIASIAGNAFGGGPSPDEARKRLEGVIAGRKAGDEGALRVSDEYLSALASIVNEADIKKQQAALLANRPGVHAADPFHNLSPEQAAAAMGVILDPEAVKKAEAQEKELATIEAARQKRIHDTFGKRPPSDEELERALFGITSAEREKATAEYLAWQTDQYRDLERLRASGPGFVPGGDTSRGGIGEADLPPGMALGGVGSHLTEAALRGYKDLGDQSGAGFSSAFSKTIGATLGPAILAAIQGGGNIGKTIAGSVGAAFTGALFEMKDGAFTTAIGQKVGGALEKTLGTTIGGALGSMLPGIGALAGPAIDLLAKGIGKLFGGASKETNTTRDQWLEQFGGGDAFRRMAVEAGVADEALRKVFSTSKVKDFEAAAKAVADQIGAFNDEQAADAARLTAAYEKYGFTFEEIGHKAQQAQLDASAKDLIEDWRVLAGSGIDIALINERMSASINDYLQTALQVGAEIPAAMKPILERMAAQGVLTDEAGEKITDLKAAGITFSESMTQGFDRVVAKLAELIDKIGGVGSAIGNIPDADVNVNYHYNDPGPPSFDPAPYGGAYLPGFAKGTGGEYLDFKRGTPVLLHGKERVMTEGEGEGAGAVGAVLTSINNLQLTMLRAIRDNAFAMRDQAMLAIGRA